jgi:DDE superfamily endonuclease
MPVHVPGSLNRVLSLLAPAFSRPTFVTFQALVVGFLGRIGEHTVTGMWQAARLAGRVHHSRAHDFFARRRWDPDRLGLLLVAFVVERFLALGAPVRLVIDDTLFARRGPRVFGRHQLFDGTAPVPMERQARWGNCFVVLGLVLELPCLQGRPVCLPVLFRLFRPKTTQYPGRASQAELAREMVELILARVPDRPVQLLFDGLYGTRAWRSLPDRVSLITRLRSTAAVYEPAPIHARVGSAGRPRLKGTRLPGLTELADQLPFTPATITRPDRSTRTVLVAHRRCLWYHTLHTQPIRLLIIRARTQTDGYEIALASTDLDTPPSELIARYAQRWTIETSFQEAKANGTGDARNRVKPAVLRTVPFTFLCQTLTITWYQLHGNPQRDLHTRRRAAPWYQQKTTISYSDMLTAIRRELVHAEFRALAPPTRYPRKTTSPSRHPNSTAA